MSKGADAPDDRLPTVDEFRFFLGAMLPEIKDEMRRLFGDSRAEIILDHWAIWHAADVLVSAKPHCGLDDLNERLRCEQSTRGARPWTLAPKHQLDA
jgi:hypothetical protein